MTAWLSHAPVTFAAMRYLARCCLLLLVLLCPPTLHANGVTIDPSGGTSGTTTSPDGSSSAATP